MLFICLGLVRAVKNCDESLGNAVLSEVTVFHYTDRSEAGESSSRIVKHLEVFKNLTHRVTDWLTDWLTD